LPHFVVFACFAIKIQQDPTPIILPRDQELVNVAESQDLEKLVNVETQSREIPLKGLIKSPLNYALKFGYIYTKDEYIHPKIILPLYVLYRSRTNLSHGWSPSSSHNLMSHTCPAHCKTFRVKEGT
jgi:hypothetical protein